MLQHQVRVEGVGVVVVQLGPLLIGHVVMGLVVVVVVDHGHVLAKGLDQSAGDGGFAAAGAAGDPDYHDVLHSSSSVACCFGVVRLFPAYHIIVRALFQFDFLLFLLYTEGKQKDRKNYD